MNPVKGINRILLFRILSEQSTTAATHLAFQTEHETSKSRDVQKVKTKSGVIQSIGDSETEISVTSILAQGDTFATELEQAFDDGKVIEIWDLDRTGDGLEGKFPSTYFQGYMTNFSQSPNAEDDIELSMDFAINGSGKRGMATLTAEQLAVIDYIFKDTIVGG